MSALIQLFSPEIEKLIVEREQRIALIEAECGSRELALNSKEHHVLTECKIDLLGRLSEHLLVVNS